MISSAQVELIKAKYEVLKAELDERSRRLWSAVEANSFGYGGVVAVAQATGLAESTIRLGQQELKGQVGSAGTLQERRIRRQGGGRNGQTPSRQRCGRGREAKTQRRNRNADVVMCNDELATEQ